MKTSKLAIALLLAIATNAAFAANISFYEKRGYREVRRATMVPDSITVFMARQLG